jgi:polysaccharide chain length determinant protein (PEP-CTERM system associated)
MHEQFNQVVVIGQGMYRYRRQALLVAWLVAVLGWLGVLLLPNVYESRTKVYVDTDTVLKPLLRGLTPEADVSGQVALMSRALLAQPQLERVARETDMHLRARTPREFETLVDSLRERVTISVAQGSPNLYSIVYQDPDRQLSLRVVQKLLDAFVEDTIGVKRQDTSSAQRFLEEQIRDYDQKLTAAEERLAAFKKQNLGLMPGEEGDYYARMQAAMARRETLRQELAVIQQRRDELRRQIDGEEPTFGLMNSMAESASPLAGQIADMRTRLDSLLLQYTEKHPEVVALREKIAALEAQRAEERPMALPTAKTSELVAINSLDVNPVYQRLKISLKEAEVLVTETRSKAAEADSEVARLRSMINTIPEVEAQLARLNRDYEVNKAQHSALLQRLESAKLSEDAEQSRDDVRFRIIEPPVAPLKPVSPERPLFMVVVLLGALAAGLGFALLLHQLNPVFSTRRALRDAFGLPVLGSISFTPAPARRLRERMQNLRLAAAAAMLLVGFAAALLLAVYAPDVLRMGS